MCIRDRHIRTGHVTVINATFLPPVSITALLFLKWLKAICVAKPFVFFFVFDCLSTLIGPSLYKFLVFFYWRYNPIWL